MIASIDRCEVVSSPLGWFAVKSCGSVVTDIVIGHRSREDAEAAVRSNANRTGHSPTVRIASDELIDRLSRYFEGEPVLFVDIELDLRELSPFTAKVLRRLVRVDYGRRSNYQELAREAGSPRAARAVGNVMRRNRLPIVLPCHRVLATGGGMGGFSGPGGVSLKERLLDLESTATSTERKLFATPR